MNIPSACLLISTCSHCKTLGTTFYEVYSLKEHEPNIRRFLLLTIKLQRFAAFSYYQISSHIPSCFMVLAKNPVNNFAFSVEGAKDRES